MAQRLYAKLGSTREILYDDRSESAGVKLKDADLVGIPVRLVVSRKLEKTGDVEIKIRQTGEVRICPEKDLEATLDAIFKDLEPSIENLPYMEEKA